MPDIRIIDMTSTAVQYLCNKDKRLAKVIHQIGPINYTPHIEDPYSFLIHEIIEQMLSVKAGQKIYGRLENMCEGKVTPERINAFTNEELREIGTSSAKVKYIRGITDAVLNNKLNFNDMHFLSDEEVMQRLTKLHGVGSWTAKMFLMFVLDRPDILPFEDGAFLQTYRWVYKTIDCSKEAVCKKCKKWKPYSSIASRFFYKALDEGLTKEEFHLYK